METGAPIGSQTLSQRIGMRLSSASIRNVMARLEEAGLLYSPHTSAGRLPTDAGLRYFVHGLLEVGDVDESLQQKISHECQQSGLTTDTLLRQASTMLSGMSSCASLVIAPKQEAALKHVEFVYLQPGRALVVLVTDDGNVENRLIQIPNGLPPSVLVEATNYINSALAGVSLGDLKERYAQDIDRIRSELDTLSASIIEDGLGEWFKSDKEMTLVLRGQSHLINNVQHVEELEKIKNLFALLEKKESLIDLLDSCIEGDGVQIFIGAQSKLFDLTGCSVIMAPYKNTQGKMIGSLGVIGPSRINYSRIIPLVDYTAKVIGRLIGDK